MTSNENKIMRITVTTVGDGGELRDLYFKTVDELVAWAKK